MSDRYEKWFGRVVRLVATGLLFYFAVLDFRADNSLSFWMLLVIAATASGLLGLFVEQAIKRFINGNGNGGKS